MEESAIYENLGRKQTELDNLTAEYARLLGVLACVVSGEIAHDRVTVDYPAQTWSVAAVAVEEPTPE